MLRLIGDAVHLRLVGASYFGDRRYARMTMKNGLAAGTAVPELNQLVARRILAAAGRNPARNTEYSIAQADEAVDRLLCAFALFSSGPPPVPSRRALLACSPSFRCSCRHCTLFFAGPNAVAENRHIIPRHRRHRRAAQRVGRSRDENRARHDGSHPPVDLQPPPAIETSPCSNEADGQFSTTVDSITEDLHYWSKPVTIVHSLNRARLLIRRPQVMNATATIYPPPYAAACPRITDLTKGANRNHGRKDSYTSQQALPTSQASLRLSDDILLPLMPTGAPIP
jgi:hypothetical protein